MMLMHQHVMMLMHQHVMMLMHHTQSKSSTCGLLLIHNTHNSTASVSYCCNVVFD
jgi:hypothetical protein